MANQISKFTNPRSINMVELNWNYWKRYLEIEVNWDGKRFKFLWFFSFSLSLSLVKYDVITRNWMKNKLIVLKQKHNNNSITPVSIPNFCSTNIRFISHSDSTFVLIRWNILNFFFIYTLIKQFYILYLCFHAKQKTNSRFFFSKT